MSAPGDYDEIYTDELKDLWSANDRMNRLIKKLIAGAGEKTSKEHCKGMEELVEEATHHCLEEAPEKGPLLDTHMIAQYQRMTQHGIAGFGTAAAYAEALGKKDDAKKLKNATKEMHGGDEYMERLSETVNADAEDE